MKNIFTWNNSAIPEILRANRYFLNDRNFSTIYCGPTHALHMYDYDCEMIIDGKKFDISKGDITLSPAGIKTSYNLAEGGGSHYCTHFRPATIKSRKNTAFSIPLYIPADNDYSANERRFLDIIELFAAAPDSRIASFGASNALLQFLIWLSLKTTNSLKMPANKSIENKLKAIENYIDINLDKAINIRKLASRNNISQNYLAQMFRKKNAMTLQRYILMRRIDKAKFLLSGSDMPVKEIGSNIGLPDPRHFNKTFRKATGQSPTSFRLKGKSLSPARSKNHPGKDK